YGELIALLFADDARVADAAAALLKLPSARQRAIDWILAGVAGGRPAPREVIGALKPDGGAVAKALAPSLDSRNPNVRLLALQAMQAAGVDPGDLKPPLVPLLRGGDRAVAGAAAQLLGDPRSLALARVPEILADLRADSP